MVGMARDAARDWLARSAREFNGYRGAYLAGSTCWLPDETPLTPGTDTDVMVVVGEETAKPGKFVFHDVLLEVSLVPWTEVRSAAAILGDYHLAPSFRSGAILDDPTGELRRLQRCVVREYASRVWVARRLDMVQRKIVAGLDNMHPDAPFHQQVIEWVFPTGVTAHLILVAALRNPTVRKRYVAAKAVLTAYGLADRYPLLLHLLGCEAMTREPAQRHLDALGAVFDATAAVIAPDSALAFATDLHPESRVIASDGMQELIDDGLHREAVFWFVVTYARCLTALAADAPDQLDRWQPGFRDLLAELGIRSFSDIRHRSESVRARLPELRALADEIMTRNPEITTPAPEPVPHGQPGSSPQSLA